MNTERLLLLAKALDRRGRKTKNTLNMNTWLEANQPENATPCNTAGCAMGVASAIPAFQEAGLYSTINDTLHVPSIFYKEYIGYAAAQEFFGITFDETQSLFSPSSYEHPGELSPRTVASRIKRHVKRYQET